MTEAMSPVSYIGKQKRSMMMDEELDNHDRTPSLHSSNSFSSFGQLQKRGRMDNENVSPNDMPLQSSQRIEFRNPSVFGSSHSASMRNMFSHNQHTAQLQGYHESVVASLRMEHQMNTEKKTQEVNQLKALNNALIQSLDSSKKENATAQEENKLLKKAVAIQDSRNRELNAQNQQLQNVLQLAAQHIAQLEEANRNLQQQMFRGQNPVHSAHDFDRPPDLF